MAKGIGNTYADSITVDNCGKLWLANGWEIIKTRYDGSRLLIEKHYSVPFVMSLMQGNHGIVWATSVSNKIFAFMPNGKMKPCTLYPATFIFMPCALQLRNDRVLTAAFGQELVEVNPLSMEARKWNVNLRDWKRCLPRSSFIPTDLYTGTLPTTIVLNKEGHIVLNHTGMGNYDTEKFKEKLKSLD